MSADAERIIIEEIDKTMNDYIDRVLELCIRQLIDDGKVDTAQLIKTANINRTFLEKELVFPVDYAEVVNYGRRADSKMPPPKSLYDWVRRKLGVPQKDVPKVSFLIARAIGERGIEGTFFLENSIEQANKEFT